MKRLILLAIAGTLATPLAFPQSSQPHELKLLPQNVHWGYYDAAVKPVLRVASGDTIRVETMVARGVQRLVHPREVFKIAFLANAAAVALAHNHPSGDPTPSPDDVTLTTRLVAGGDLLGVDVIDHVIVGHDRTYYSFKEAQRL